MGSFVAALLANMVPLPEAVAAYWPDWVALVLIFWCLATPQRVGPTVGFGVGLAIDVIQFSLLGHNALSKTILAYLANRFHLPVRLFPLWQQAVIVLALLSLDVAIVVWVHGVVNGLTVDGSAWLPAISGMVIWPLLFVALRATRGRAQLA